jgi:hypothetical protein
VSEDRLRELAEELNEHLVMYGWEGEHGWTVTQILEALRTAQAERDREWAKAIDRGLDSVLWQEVARPQEPSAMAFGRMAVQLETVGIRCAEVSTRKAKAEAFEAARQEAFNKSVDEGTWAEGANEPEFGQHMRAETVLRELAGWFKARAQELREGK